MSFLKRSSDNACLLDSIRKVPERHAALKDGAEKSAFATVLQPAVIALTDALGSKASNDAACAEWTMAQSTRDARNRDADDAVRLAHARLVEWCAMRGDDPLVLGVFPRGVRFVIDADDVQPEAMTLLVESVRDSRDARLTPERRAEFAAIVGRTSGPLGEAHARARTAWARKRLAAARYDRATDAAWVAAHNAYVVAGMNLPASLVADVFAPVIEHAAVADPAADAAPAPATSNGSTPIVPA